jgi:glycosyltransferase involved in cell wall biosynthesis
MLRDVPEVFGGSATAPPLTRSRVAPAATTIVRATAQVPVAPKIAARGKRILMIVESAAGGTGRHVLDLAEGMSDRGHDVHVVYSTGRIDRFFQARLATMDHVRQLPVAMRTSIHPTDFRVVRTIRRYEKEHGPFDIVHGHSSKAGALARLVAMGTRAQAVYTLHGLIMMDPKLALWKRAFYLAIELGLSLRTQRIIAVAPEEARAAVRLGLGRKRVTVVPNGVEEDITVPRDVARRELGLAPDNICVGFIGRLVEQKAPEVLLRGFARAVRSAPQLRLAIVGSGPLMSEMQALAAELRIGNRVLWLGERDARGVIAAFDVFAISSRKEGLPYVVLEAMSAGLPVVATSSAGVEILVEPGVNGFVIPPEEPTPLGDALEKLATNPESREAMGKASRELVKRFSVEAMIENTLRAYEPTPDRENHDPRPINAKHGLFGPEQDIPGELLT